MFLTAAVKKFLVVLVEIFKLTQPSVDYRLRRWTRKTR